MRFATCSPGMGAAIATSVTGIGTSGGTTMSRAVSVAANVFSPRLAFFAVDVAFAAPAPSLSLLLSSSSLLARRLTRDLRAGAAAPAAPAAALRRSMSLLVSAFKIPSIAVSISSMAHCTAALNMYA